MHVCNDLPLQQACNSVIVPTVHIDLLMREEGSKRLTNSKRRWGERSGLKWARLCASIFSVVPLNSRFTNSFDGMNPIKRGHYDNSGEQLKDHRIKMGKYIRYMCKNASFSYGYLTIQTAPIEKNASFSMWETWQTMLAGGEQQILPRCQSTTCIVMLWHFKHLEHTLFFEASSFPQEENTNQHGGQLWPEGLREGFVTARLPVWLQTIWE